MRVRKIDLTFTALTLPLDILALFAAGIGAYLLRFSRFVTEVRPVLQNLPFQDYLQTVSLFVLVWLALFVLAGLYSTQPRRAWNEMGRVALACTAGTMILIAAVFFRRDFATSRFIILAIWLFSFILVFVERITLRTIRHLLLKYGIGHLSIVIIGKGLTADGVREEYERKPILGYTVIKQFNVWNDETRRTLDKLRKKTPIDVVLLAEPDLPKQQALDLISYTEEHHIAFHYLADLFAARFRRIDISTGVGVPIVEVKPTRLDGWGRIAKRGFDVIGSLFFLIITSPLTLFSMLFVLIEDGWPLFFINERIGENGGIFYLYKLRSMYKKYCIGPQFQETPKNIQFEKKLIAKASIKEGPVYKIKNDPRVMKIGVFTRRWSIDELPQFWNVLRGDMSMVGPRPHQPREVAKYELHHRRVLNIKPGITGMAQISGRSNLSFEDEVRLDTWYIENWSPLLDLYILLKTPFAVLKGNGAT